MTQPKPVDLEMLAIEILQKPLDYMWFRSDDINLVTALMTEIRYLRTRVKELEDGRDKNTSLDGDLCRRYR